MRFGKTMAVFAAVSMVAMPTMAIAQPAAASKLSVASSVRASADEGEEKLAGGGLVIAALAVAAIVAGIVIATDGDDDPVSA